MNSTSSPAHSDEADTLLRQAFAAHRQGDLEEARRLYGAVLAVAPDEARALANLGVLHLQRGEAALALPRFDQSLAVRPDQPAVLANRAGALRALGRNPEALESARQALALDPDHADALNAEGLLLTELGFPDQALASLDRAVERAPQQPYYLNNRGVALSTLARPEEALASFDAALALAPGYVEALSNRAATLRALGRLEDALQACEQLLALHPGHVDAQVNKGCVLRDLGRPAEALAAFEQACALLPHHVEAHWSLALQLLAMGRWREGWPLFEWRWRRPDFQPLVGRFSAPPWLGEQPVAGKSLLLHYEQGLGDSIQMLRYVELLAERGARIVLAVQRPLLPLARRMKGVAAAIGEGDPLPSFDLHSPLMSLPLAFGTEPNSVPWRGAYLSAPPDAASAWAQRLAELKGPRIGLVWSGNPRHLNDANRSLPLADLEPLLQADARFVSLQKDYRPGERDQLAGLGVTDLSEDLADLGDTAAAIAALDAVVSVDTSVAHLAGALGKPLLLLLPFAPDFRWGTGGEASPWYPTARLLRQAAPGDWAAPLRQASALIAASFFDTAATAHIRTTTPHLSPPN